jgi:hypothetical protein
MRVCLTYIVVLPILVWVAVLAAFSKDGSPTAGQSAEALLRKMRALYENGTLDTNPDVVSYNWCVTGKRSLAMRLLISPHLLT